MWNVLSGVNNSTYLFEGPVNYQFFHSNTGIEINFRQNYMLNDNQNIQIDNFLYLVWLR